MTTTKKNDTEHASELDAWSMLTAIWVGLDQAARKANEEYLAAVEAGKGRPMAPGTGKAVAIRNSLIDARDSLGPDMAQIARANDLPLPEGF